MIQHIEKALLEKHHLILRLADFLLSLITQKNRLWPGITHVMRQELIVGLATDLVPVYKRVPSTVNSIIPQVDPTVRNTVATGNSRVALAKNKFSIQ